jgi:hypothetical protein
MALSAREPLALRPAAVPVHHDRDVTGNTVTLEGRGDRRGTRVGHGYEPTWFLIQRAQDL